MQFTSQQQQQQPRRGLVEIAGWLTCNIQHIYIVYNQLCASSVTGNWVGYLIHTAAASDLFLPTLFGWDFKRLFPDIRTDCSIAYITRTVYYTFPLFFGYFYLGLCLNAHRF
jgi:hypothetical protein